MTGVNHLHVCMCFLALLYLDRIFQEWIQDGKIRGRFFLTKLKSSLAVTAYIMVADLCHFLISFSFCELTIIFVFSPRNNDKTTRNTEINEAVISPRYLSSLSPAIYRLFATKTK